MKFVGVHILIYPTTLILNHRVEYTRQSPFFHIISIPQAFVFIWRTIYTHFHEIGLGKTHKHNFEANLHYLMLLWLIWQSSGTYTDT